MLLFLETSKETYRQSAKEVADMLTRRGLKVSVIDNNYSDHISYFFRVLNEVMTEFNRGNYKIFIINSSSLRIIRDVIVKSNINESEDFNLNKEVDKFFLNAAKKLFSSKPNYALKIIEDYINGEFLNEYILFKNTRNLFQHHYDFYYLVSNSPNIPVVTILDKTNYYTDNNDETIKNIDNVFDNGIVGKQYNKWLSRRVAYPYNILYPFYKLRDLIFRKDKGVFTNNGIFKSYIFKYNLTDYEENGTYNIKPEALDFIERTTLMYTSTTDMYSNYVTLPRIESIVD